MKLTKTERMLRKALLKIVDMEPQSLACSDGHYQCYLVAKQALTDLKKSIKTTEVEETEWR